MTASRIRPATPGDATHLACFVDMASGGLALHLWRQIKPPEQSLFEYGRARALRAEGSFSYRNAHIAEVDGAVAGGLVGYRIDEDFDPQHRTAGVLSDTPPYLRPLVELEGLIPGYWYVNVLATYPEYRSRGIGAALLAEADRIGKGAGTKGMALIASSENRSALGLYERCGYRLKDRRAGLAVPEIPAKGDWLLLAKPHS